MLGATPNSSFDPGSLVHLGGGGAGDGLHHAPLAAGLQQQQASEEGGGDSGGADNNAIAAATSTPGPQVWTLVMSESQEAFAFGAKPPQPVHCFDEGMMPPEPGQCASPDLTPGADDGGYEAGGAGAGGGGASAGQQLLDVGRTPDTEARRRSIGRIDVSQFHPEGFDSLTDSMANSMGISRLRMSPSS